MREQDPMEAIARSMEEGLDIADTFDVGEATTVQITRMREPGVNEDGAPNATLQTGDILRRTCQYSLAEPELGAGACAALCQRPEEYENVDKRCSDLNLKEAATQLGVQPESLLMIGVTANKVGYADQLESYGDQVKTSSVGIRELAGYNAFFTRDSDEMVIGGRLADCGFAVIEMKDAQGETVRGFAHLSRPNMRGEAALADDLAPEGKTDAARFEIDGEPAGVFEYFMHEAVGHYGADPASVRVSVVAGIRADNFAHTFTGEDRSRPDVLFPGWAEQGMVKDADGNDYDLSAPADPDKTWYPQYRDMLRWQVSRAAERLAIPAANIDVSDDSMIDPGDLELGHASNHAGFHGRMPDARDAYIVRPRPTEQ